MLRVALITAHGWVGVSTPVIMTANYLASRNFRVDIYITEDKFCQDLGIAVPKFTNPNINVIIHQPKQHQNTATFDTADLMISGKDIDFVTEYKDSGNRYDWIIGFDPGGLNRAALLSNIWKTPFLYHSLELLDTTGPEKETEKLLSQLALGVLTQDENRAALLSRMNSVTRDRIHVVYNSAIGKIQPEKQDYFRTQFNISSQKKIVLATGTLLPLHGIDQIMDSVIDWPDDFVLVLHGWIPDKTFEHQIAAKISTGKNRIFLSTEILEQDQKRIVFQSADIGLVYFQPVDLNCKYAAGSSGKLFDFMQTGVPIIGNDIPGMRDLIEGNQCGLVVQTAGQIGPVLPHVMANYDHFRNSCFKAFEKYEFSKCYDTFLKQIYPQIKCVQKSEPVESPGRVAAKEGVDNSGSFSRRVDTQAQRNNGKPGVPNVKVVHLCSQDFGGAGKAAYRLHKSLNKAGVESKMLVMRKQSQDPSVKVVPDEFDGKTVRCLQVDEFESQSYLRQTRRWQNSMAAYPNRPSGNEIFTDAVSEIPLDLIREVQEADIVHFHWMAGLLDYVRAPLSLRTKPIVWTLHDLNPFTGGCHYPGDCKKYKHTCEACPQLGSDAVDDLSKDIWMQKRYAYETLNIHPVGPSRWMAECATSSRLFSGFHVHVIANGFPLDIFRPYPRTEIRSALHLPPSMRVILFGADSLVNKRKGFIYLVEALKRLSQIGEQHNIALITFGNLPQEIKIALKYPVYSLGYVSDENRVAQIYNAADVFVIPSLEDNLPNTAIEAMACGVPVVGFNSGGISEIIDHQKTGYVVEPGDIGDLTQGINWVLTAQNDGHDFSVSCRQRVEKKFALDAQAGMYRELYTGLMQGKTGTSKRSHKSLNWERKIEPDILPTQCRKGQAGTSEGLFLKGIHHLNHNPPGQKEEIEFCTHNGAKLKMLNLGCGGHYNKDWINIDFESSGPEVIGHNLCLGIPVPDEACDVVYHSHLLEHFPRRFATEFLKECYRVLKPGGIIRVVQPDLEQIVRLYLDTLEKSLKGEQASQMRYEWIVLELLDQMVRNRPGGEMLEYWKQNPMPAESFVIERCGAEVKKALKAIRSKPQSNNHVEDPYIESIRSKNGSEIKKLAMFRMSGEVHQWMYDRYSLNKLLRETGFVEIKSLAADQSDIPEFNRYFLDIEPTGEVRKPDSFFMEARKIG